MRLWTGVMTAELLDGLLWAAIFGTAVASSAWLHRNLGVMLASQGLVATACGLVFGKAVSAGLAVALAIGAAGIVGLVLGLGHVALLRATSREIVLVASVLVSFFLTDLWISVPGLTGGSGGFLVERRPTVAATAIAAAALLSSWGMSLLLPSCSNFITTATRELGLSAGVLGVPTNRIFVGGFSLFGAGTGLLGAAGVSVSGVSGPSLFGVSWSLCVLVVVVAPRIPPAIRTCLLPLVFVGTRWAMRALLPPSVGFSQLAELAFPIVLVAWARLASSGGKE